MVDTYRPVHADSWRNTLLPLESTLEQAIINLNETSLQIVFGMGVGCLKTAGLDFFEQHFAWGRPRAPRRSRVEPGSISCFLINIGRPWEVVLVYFLKMLFKFFYTIIKSICQIF